MVHFPFQFSKKDKIKLKTITRLLKNLQNILGEDPIWITPPHLQDFSPQKLQLPSIFFYDQQENSEKSPKKGAFVVGWKIIDEQRLPLA